MPLDAGSRLGPYEILSSLGAGGMGEVYKATDTRLDRSVAIKVLPSDVASDPERRERFEREARAIAALNHPHICTLHEFDNHEGIDFLVMEHLEGESLADRLTTGRVPVEQAIEYALQVADALDKAHKAGITHRDLKPGNVFLTKNGAKLLDFGLAKLREAGPGGDASTRLAESLTQKGTILGTFQYMAPEQLEGHEADARSDIWAFGALLYEMVTGARAFDGKSQASLISAIMSADPQPMSVRQPLSPPELEQVVRTCLAKDPDNRWQSAGEVRRHLRLLTGKTTPITTTMNAAAPAAVRPAAWRAALPWMLAVSVASILVTALVVWLLRPTPTPQLSRWVITPPIATPLELTNSHPDIALTPDGLHLVYTATSDRFLYRRSLDQLDAVKLMDREQTRSPFISPNSAWVGFHDAGDGALKKVSIHGGPAVTICEAGTLRAASWGANDVIVFAQSGAPGLFIVSAAGGSAKPLTTVEATSGDVHGWPEILPDGRAVVFTRGAWTAEASIAVADVATGTVTDLGLAGTSPHYVSSGHLLYAVADGSIRAVHFDPKTLTIGSSPVPVLENVNVKTSGAANYVVSAGGHLASVTGEGAASPKRTLVWVDRDGRETPIAAPARNYFYPRIAPDGTRVALDVRDEQNDVWIWDLRRETLSRLTTDPGDDSYALWTPDSRYVVYSSGQGGQGPRLFKSLADTGLAEPITQPGPFPYPNSITPDGTQVIYRAAPVGGRASDLFRVPLNAGGETTTVLSTEFDELNGEVSPDGRWLAYESDFSGSEEVYVAPFPDVQSERFQISTNGGRKPAWSPDGRELFYIGRQDLMVVAVDTRSSFTPGTPKSLFPHAGYFDAGTPGRTYDIAPDGLRFILIKRGTAGQDDEVPIGVTVMLNWVEELKRLVPIK